MVSTKILRSVFLCLIVAAMAAPASAQQGIKVGGFFLPQASFLYNADDAALDEDLFQRELLPGMAGGLVFGYHFNDIIGVRMNLIYSQEGGRYSARRDAFFRDDFTTRLEYLKIPIMLGFNTDPLFNKVMFSAYGGVQANILTRAWTYSSNPVYIPPTPEGAYRLPSSRDQHAFWTYSAVVDLGVDIFLTQRAVLNISFRGDVGLIDSEDKAATYLFSSGGESGAANYWDWVRGGNASAQTLSVNTGLLFGLTYTLGKNVSVIPSGPEPIN